MVVLHLQLARDQEHLPSRHYHAERLVPALCCTRGACWCRYVQGDACSKASKAGCRHLVRTCVQRQLLKGTAKHKALRARIELLDQHCSSVQQQVARALRARAAPPCQRGPVMASARKLTGTASWGVQVMRREPIVGLLTHKAAIVWADPTQATMDGRAPCTRMRL